MKNTVLILLVSFIFNNHKINNFNSDYFYDFLLCEYYSLKNLVHETNNCYLSLEEKIYFLLAMILMIIKQ